MTTYVRGAIGYTILKKDNIYIMLIADMHKTTEDCGTELISDWLRNQKDIKLLLEEIPSSHDNFKQLWSDSQHTNELRKLYLCNNSKVVPVDIRGELVPYSWELLDTMKFPPTTLHDYLMEFNIFFDLTHPYFSIHIPQIYKAEILTPDSQIGQHFIMTKNKYKEFLNKYTFDLGKPLDVIKNGVSGLNMDVVYKEKRYILEDLSFIQSAIMEFYTIAQLYTCLLNNNNITKFVIHCGLFHTSNLLAFLTDVYKFEIIENKGLTTFDQVDNVDHNGCYRLPKF